MAVFLPTAGAFQVSNRLEKEAILHRGDGRTVAAAREMRKMNTRELLGIAAVAIAFTITACAETEPPGLAEASESAPAPYTNEAEAAAATIIGEDLRASVARISADEFAGRGPATAGDRAAREHLIGELQALGYEPGGPDGEWEQAFDIVGVTASMPERWVFERSGETLALQWWDQYIAGSGVQAERAAVDAAEVVFVGYGIQAPEYGWDDFKGQDLEGKVLLMLNNDPDWDPALFAGETRLYYGRWDYKYESAARQGAAAAIIIHTQPSAGYPFQVVQTSWSGEQFQLPAGDGPRIQVEGWVTEAAAAELAALGGRDLAALVEAARRRDFTPVSLGVTTSLAFSNRVNRVQTANVFGLLEGGDPQLRDEVVIYTAHHDHLGVGMPDDSGDAIYNGALDNGAGLAQALAIAKAFRALPTPPRRSIMMLFVGAEEQGLLGSQYYAEHPTFPPGRIAANINYDGGNIWGPTRDVTFIGMGKSTLDAVVERVAARQDRVVKPDQFPDRGFFYRSDQFNFAKIGVPALFLDTGTDFVGRPPEWGRERVELYEDNNYHQPSDELRPDWNFDGMVDDARLGFWTGLIVANADRMPSWNPGDEFEAARLAALRNAR
jgi:Zn-dependent M28 family amino/carboxypeptidase